MRQVLIRAVALLRRPTVLLVLLVLVGGGCAGVTLPLLGLPGFELSLLMTVAVGLLGGLVGIAAAHQERRLIQGRDPRPKNALREDQPLRAVWNAAAAAFVLLFVPLVIVFLTAVVHALLTTRCDPFAQVGFYPLLTLPSALLAAAAGVFAGFAGLGFGTSLLVLLGLLFLSAVGTAWPYFAGPQVFAFNLFAGYFPGPLYDEALHLTAALGWFRLETLLWTALLLTLTALLLNMRGGLLGGLHLRPVSALLLGGLIAGIAVLESRAPALGMRMTYDRLEALLDGRRQTDHFQLFFQKSKPKLEVDRWVRDLEFRHAQLEKLLGPAPAGGAKLRVYLYPSAEQKLAWVGAGNTQYAKPWQATLHVNDAPFPHPTLKHELAHVMMARFGSGPLKITTRWGLLPDMAVVEGAAVALDDPVSDLNLQQWAAAMRRQHLAPDMNQLFGPAGFYANAAPRAYTAAGSFLRYLADHQGMAKLEALYAHGDFQAAFGRPLPDLVQEWERTLDGLPLDPRDVHLAFARFHEGSLFARSCVREVAGLQVQAQEALAGDPQRASELFERCAQLQPDEPTFRLAQAQALAKLGKLPEASAILGDLHQHLTQDPEMEAQVALEQADLAWQLGRKDIATARLREALGLKPGPEIERAADVKLAAALDPVSGAALWSYFQPSSEDVRLLKLRLAWERAPNNPFINYLLGRRLAQEREPALASKFLGDASAGALPETVRREAWRLYLQSLYEAGDCAGLKNATGHLPDLGHGLRAGADEWNARCDFEQHAFGGPLVPPDSFR